MNDNCSSNNDDDTDWQTFMATKVSQYNASFFFQLCLIIFLGKIKG